MERIIKYEQYANSEKLAKELIDRLLYISESDDIDQSNVDKFKKIHKNIVKELRFNFKFITTFGMGITVFYPFIESLIKHSKLDITVTDNTIVMMGICIAAIIYLEEKKGFINKDDENYIKKWVRSVLEEFRLNGVYGIVKKITKSMSLLKTIFSIISKNVGNVIESVVDMFSYTALFVPFLNAVNYVVSKHDMDIDSLISNLASMSFGVTTIAVKHYFKDIINRLRNKFKINIDTDIVDTIEASPEISKPEIYGDIIHEIKESVYDNYFNTDDTLSDIMDPYGNIIDNIRMIMDEQGFTEEEIDDHIEDINNLREDDFFNTIENMYQTIDYDSIYDEVGKKFQYLLDDNKEEEFIEIFTSEVKKKIDHDIAKVIVEDGIL